jgi:outer membrane protein TolC
VATESLDEVTGALPPLTLKNSENYEMWDLSLEEATRITLCNSNVMRQLGGRVLSSAPETLTRNLINSAALVTTYDPAIAESATGTTIAGVTIGGTGVESALAEFDAQLDASTSWQKVDRPQNRDIPGIFNSNLQQDLGNSTIGITKFTAPGTEFSFRNNTNYEWSNQPGRTAPSDWETNFEAFFRQPLLQGAGLQYNRIAGPQRFDQYSGNFVNSFDGVVIARIRTDQALADFEGGVRNLMRDVETAYWELYFTYRDLEARKMGRDSALETWKKVAALFREGARGGSADREAQARAQYFLFRGQVEQALTELYRAESRLRYIMGIAMADGRLIRPCDELTTAGIEFDWCQVHGEALVRRVEIRRQKFEIKRRELELIAARNHLLPRLDASGTYRWVGAGNDLWNDNGIPPFREGSSAFEVLTGGDYQEWELGLQLNIPIGYRRQLSGVRNHQLLLARDRAILKDLELEISHQLGEALRSLALNYQLTETNFNRRVAAQREVEAIELAFENDFVTFDLLLDAQARRADAESAYYRALVDYNLAIMNVHYNKDTLLDYNGVLLAEGPWPGKAYFDAMRRARKRDAALFIDYGYSRPNVFSQGPFPQQTGAACNEMYTEGEVVPHPTPAPVQGDPEQLPMPNEGDPSSPATPATPTTSNVDPFLDAPVTSTAVLLPTQCEPQPAAPLQYTSPVAGSRLFETGYEPTGNPLRPSANPQP